MSVSFTETSVSLILHNLPVMHERRLLVPKINLIMQPVRAVDNGLDDGINDIAAVHGNFHAISDLELPWGRVGLFRHGGIVRRNAFVAVALCH
jgi:hypothetical protein